MRKPTPKLVLRDGELRWYVDARALGLGQYTLQTPGVSELQSDAIWETVELIAKEREAKQARSAQLGLPVGGPTIRDVARARADEREFRSDGGESWAGDCSKRILARWGSTALVCFRGLQGFKLGQRWVEEMAAEPLATKTRRNVLNELWALFTYAVERECGWLDEVPRKPSPCLKGERLESPEQPTYTEADFRALRAGLYATHDHPGGLAREIPDRAERLDVIERRRLYLSFAFYTGMRVADLDRIDDRNIGTDAQSYTRTGQKTGERRAAFDAPEQLRLDVQAEWRRLGRPFRKGEAIGGGAWPRGAVALADAARRLGLPLPINFRSVIRSSTARELLIRGWTMHEVAHVLGHRSTAMLERVYAVIPPRLRSPIKVPWDRASTALLLQGRPVTERAKVLRIEPRRAARRLQSVGEE